MIYFLASAVADVCLNILRVAQQSKCNLKNSLYLFCFLESHSLALQLFGLRGDVHRHSVALLQAPQFEGALRVGGIVHSLVFSNSPSAKPPKPVKPAAPQSLPAASLTGGLWTTHPQSFPVAEGFEGFVVFRETITARSNPLIGLEQGRLLCHLLRCINWVQNVGIYLIQASVPFRSNGFPVTLALLTFSPLPTPRCPPQKNLLSAPWNPTSGISPASIVGLRRQLRLALPERMVRFGRTCHKRCR